MEQPLRDPLAALFREKGRSAVAGIEELVAIGQLHSGAPHRTMRNRVAAWLSEIGLPHTIRNNTRADTLLRVHR